MQEHKIILTWEAIYDITDITDYIESAFGIERADRFQHEVQEQLKSLEQAGCGFGKTHIRRKKSNLIWNNVE